MAYTAYRVLRAPIDQVEAFMAKAISEGWQPLGGPFTQYPDDRIIHQAIVKGTPSTGGSGDVAVDDIEGASDVGKAVLAAEDPSAARSAIGAGTSSLALGSTGSTAKPGNYQPNWNQVQEKPAVIAAGEDAVAARQAIGAGTSNLVLGTTGTTAKAGNYQPNWGDVGGKPAVIAAGSDQAAARQAIGAGTSNLELGTTGSTAKPGNYAPSWGDVSNKPATFPPPAATAGAVGGVQKASAVTDATDTTDVIDQFNALLAALRTSGAISS